MPARARSLDEATPAETGSPLKRMVKKAVDDLTGRRWHQEARIDNGLARGERK
jgi:hypothetical protein